MKRIFQFFIFLTFFNSLFAGQFIYKSKDQEWVLTDIRSNDNYTVIYCDIFIRSYRAGCFDAHEFDKSNSSIYIYGDFGKSNLIRSEFTGKYKPWEIYTDIYMWNYFESNQEGRVAHAIFYFPRIPAGVTNIGWYYNGGWADESAPSNKYKTPQFDIRNIKVKNNENTTSHTGWSEVKLKEHWSTHRPLAVEGIYKLLDTSDPLYWGNARHKIAVKKEGENYQIIYLNGSSNAIWTEGEIKAIFSPTSSRGIYNIDKWYLDNKMLATSELYIEYNPSKMTIYDIESNVETCFIKLYPARDIDEVVDSSIYPQVTPNNNNESLEPKGNGSAFFVGRDVLATNYHVVKDAKKIEVILFNNKKKCSYKAKVLCSDKNNDIALLQIVDTNFSPFLTLPYEITSTINDVGTDIYAMGYPYASVMGQEIKVTDGIISSKTGYDDNIVTYQISAPIQPGNSGGPMFNKEGQVIGITSSGIPGAENVGYAIKTAYLNNLIDSAPIEIENICHKQEIGKDLTEQIKLFKQYITLVLIY